MSNYSQKFNKFDLAREVLANRYMLTTLLVNINNLVYFLEGKEKALRELLPEDKRQALHKVIKFRDTIEFDMFELSNRYFNALSNKFKPDVVSSACVLLDDYIKEHPQKKLSQQQINKKIREYCERYNAVDMTKEYLTEAIKNATKIDYKLIDNPTIARQYIMGVPFYMRSLDEGCKYLKEKFDL